MNTKKPDKHLLMMVLCCLIVAAVILILPKFVNLGSSGWIILLLLCPLSHIVMMKFMPKDGSKSCHDTTSNKQLKKKGGENDL